MILLFDENLSFRLVEQLADVYPHSLHVRDVGGSAPYSWTRGAHARFVK